MRDIYERPDEFTLDLEELYCLLINCKPLNFEEAVKDKRWRHAIEEDIKSIEKNNT
ncbi:copia-type polyprotein [Sesbania bispinosa]|nr:copia-type polyprotein [Sesbania bispinosa]